MSYPAYPPAYTGTHIRPSRETCLVGETVTWSFVGTRAGNVLRWYVSSAPPGSELDTLETYAADNLELSDIRLKVDQKGQASFVPDVAGRYVIACRDVREWVFAAHYGGHSIEPEATQQDNEEAALGTYAQADTGVTGTATEYTRVFWVAAERSRTIGTTPDTAVVKIRSYADRVDDQYPTETGNESVTLTAANTTAAKLAARSADVQTVLADLQDAGTDASNLRLDELAAIDRADLDLIRRQWNAHLASTGPAFVLHGGAGDAVNAVAAGEPTTLAEAITVLNEMRTKYNLHCPKTAGSVHAVADSNVLTAPVATDFASAVTLWLDMRTNITARHFTAHTVHGLASGSIVDGNGNKWDEEPADEPGLIARVAWLRSAYNDHVSATTRETAHGTADTDNVITGKAPTNQGGFVSMVNKLADAIERHAANLDANNTLTTLYHDHGSGGTPAVIKIPLRASSMGDAQRVLELCVLAIHQHLLDGGDATDAHKSPALGGHAPLASFYNPHTATSTHRMMRLHWAWQEAVKQALEDISFDPDVSDENFSDDWLVQRYGWTLCPLISPPLARTMRAMRLAMPRVPRWRLLAGWPAPASRLPPWRAPVLEPAPLTEWRVGVALGAALLARTPPVDGGGEQCDRPHQRTNDPYVVWFPASFYADHDTDQRQRPHQPVDE